MGQKEAAARIKINRLLEESGWRFFDEGKDTANIKLEAKVKLEELGDDFQHTKNGFVDFLLLGPDGFPLVVLEAKKESIPPLFAKEQARKYARSQHARYIILSNGNVHYLWDTERGDPQIITRFPTQDSLVKSQDYEPKPESLSDEKVGADYIALSQDPKYEQDPRWQAGGDQKAAFTEANGLKFMRPYQVDAVKALQKAAGEGKMRYLFEMATGTGKTLTTAALAKLFLRTGNATRILFLVDRLELEDQALKAFKQYLQNDYRAVIYKEHTDSWQSAKIVISTVQTLLSNNRYQSEFSPTDFQLVISDEAHRSIGGNARAVFEYFIGYKLGLTATT
jgi:type I restriction enzyme R subunit